MTHLGRLIAAGACALACTLSACGGGSGGAGTAVTPATPAERQVRSAVQEVLTTRRPSACTRLMTRRFVERTSAEHGAAALRTCRQNADEAGAKTLSIDRVSIAGAGAVADVSPSGGSLPFVHATLGLRKVAGRWKLDSLRGGKLDRPAFGRVLEHDLLTSRPHHVSRPVAVCVVNASARLTERVIVQRFFVHPDRPTALGMTTVCSLDVQLQRAGASPGTVACADRAARRAISGRLRHALSDLRDFASGVAFGRRLGAEIVRACSRRARTSLE
jgi:hypothetical protein